MSRGRNRGITGALALQLLAKATGVRAVKGKKVKSVKPINPAELLFMEQCLTAPDVLEPMREYHFALNLGRKWVFDFAWPEKKLALEVEGGIWTRGAHGSGAGIKRDMEKYNAAALLGWWILRFAPEEINSGEAIEFVRQFFGRAS